MDKPDDPVALEAWARAELSRLEDMAAPPDLTAAVWARLQAEASRPWWQRSWWSWPLWGRTALGVPLLALTILFALGPWLLEPYWPGSTALLAPLWQKILGLAGLLAAVGRGLLLLGEALVSSPWWWGAAALVAVAYLWFVGVGTVLFRFAQHQAHRGGTE